MGKNLMAPISVTVFTGFLGIGQIQVDRERDAHPSLP